MRLGILADTHDNVPNVLKAVEVFNSESVDLVFHAGDYVAPFSVKPLLKLKCEFLGVFGNNDGDKIALKDVSEGKICAHYSIRSFGGKKVLLGHYFEPLEALVKSGEYDFIIYGHTHQAQVRREGRCTVINPGECGGWLYGSPSISLLDLDTGDVQIVTLD